MLLGLNCERTCRCYFLLRNVTSVPKNCRFFSNQPSSVLLGSAQTRIPISQISYTLEKKGAGTADSYKKGHARSQNELDASFVGLSGGQIFHEMMLRHDVKHIFGYPGGAILPTFDAIYQSPYFKFILPRHEQGAGHMAEGYARASGKPGVVLVTSGPGATNTITAMADALADGTPLVVFSGQVPISAIGTDAFQEADVVGISQGATKWNSMVKHVEDLPRKINEAFEIAMKGRPGPVLLDLPKDVQASILTKPIPTNISLPRVTRQQIDEKDIFLDDQLDRVANLINNANQPVIFAGQGIISSAREGPDLLRELALRSKIPVATSLLGLGCFDEYHPYSMHMVGMHGSCYANLALQEADVIINLGARFDDRVICNPELFAPAAKQAALLGKGGIIHFDILPKNIDKIVQTSEAVEGDVVNNLRKLLPKIKTKKEDERRPWLEKVRNWKELYPFTYSKTNPNERIKSQEVIEEISKQCADIKDKVIVTTGVGQHQMWAAQHFRWQHPRSFISSGGLGTMGFGLPAAIGAQMAKPDHIVIDIDGDASLSMTCMELMTAAQFEIPVKVLVLNNAEQGMVAQWQNLFYNSRYAHTDQVNPDFVKLAESMGVKGIHLSKIEDLSSKVHDFLSYRKGPVLMEVDVAIKEHVYPMVPAGKGLHQFITDSA